MVYIYIYVFVRLCVTGSFHQTGFAASLFFAKELFQ